MLNLESDIDLRSLPPGRNSRENQPMACTKRLFLLLAFFLAGRAVWGASAAQEQSAWKLWSLHTNAPARHEAVLAACQQMLAGSPTNPLVPLGQGLAAWHNLRLGKTNEAAALFSAMAAAPPVSSMATAGVEMGRRWLTRFDREKVRGALSAYYRRAVEYPAGLQPLQKTTPDLPLADRWGAPWEYRLAAFKIIQSARGQRYRLQSKTLGESSDLAKALARPYAGQILFQPLSISVLASGAQNVVFELPGERPEKILMSAGAQSAGITLAHIGSLILILSDGDHWRVFIKPSR